MKPRISDRYWALFEDRPEKNILFLLDGGTIDGKSYMHTPPYIQYMEPPDFIAPLRHSRIPKYLIAHGYDTHCFCIQHQMKDSQDITDSDIDKAALSIAAARQDKVPMSCGTSDMARIANRLAVKLALLGVSGKTVIITGAMEPLKHGAISDGPDNIGHTMEALLHTDLLPGVYVGMRDRENNYRIFRVDDALEKKTDPIGDGRHKRYFTGNRVDIEIPEPRPPLRQRR